MSITLCENFRAMFYAPFYAAHALGAYEAEGVDVVLAESPTPGATISALRRGEADVAWGGPLRVLMHHDQDSDCDLVCFCEVVTRDPFFLIGREPNPAFRFRDLVGPSVGIVSEVPTPWLCLQEDMRQAGIDPEAIDAVSSRTMPENVDALRAGAVDVVQLFQPYAEELLRSGAHLWYAAADRGHTAYTSFYTRRATLAERRDELLAMTRAIYRVQKWLQDHDGSAVHAAVEAYFPQADGGIMAAAIDRYRSLGVYGRNPILPRDGFDRLRRSMIESGFIAKGAEFEQCVDNSLAEAVIAVDPPPL